MDSTKIIHQKHEELKGSNRPLVAPIYQSVKFVTDTVAELDEVLQKREWEYIYSRLANPTVRQLEKLLASLQGGEDCICTATGIASISTSLLALLSQGDHIILGYESYSPTRHLVRGLLARYGVDTTFVSMVDLQALERAIRPGDTKLVLFESPTNPIGRVPDVEAIVRICQKANALSVLDNSAAGFHNYGQYPVDLYVHSLTKYASGHGDVMGGAIIGPKELVKKIRMQHISIGANLDANSAFMIVRGMKTYPLRYRRQAETAGQIADFLGDHPKVERVVYPGRKDHPDHSIAKDQLIDYGGIITAYLKDTGVTTFLDSLSVFQVSSSFGSPESLAAPIQKFFGGDLSESEKEIADIRPNAVRLAIGLEEVDDLKKDLDAALAHL